MIVIIVALAFCALTVLIYMKKSGKFIKSLFLSSIQGFAALLAVNAAGTMTGVLLPLNALTLSSSAVFGTPGVIMNLIAQIILLKVHT